ncbi:LL-diaminopimelate aminotransferase [Moorena sp. SIO4G3]|uniref:LL-diaminopimelate aminotransferase n=1 Tax=Moorena sp. SIO4G3 TaxID=2607821 RepID=UPI001429B03C|nr:LL-diaminopimelate aminotransferase [Moorena sp. SIO4G3]NEO77801.1 LL-diaminopimelate aminotransferase [Moorena sp. SIO4G3]
MTTTNPNLRKLFVSDTFADMVKNKLMKKMEAHQASNPQKELYIMAWGDTTQPLPPKVVDALVDAATKLGDRSTYTGYGEFDGNIKLREAICNNYYKPRGIDLKPEEIFVSDGAQSVTFGLQDLFGLDNVIALQDPIYPPYLEANLLAGRSNIIYLECNDQNNFVPDIPTSKVDIIYLCFPNNPTGGVATKEQLKVFVDYAISHKSVIIFDAVYSAFITDPNIPRSIYEIEGATECAIEVGSFSKTAGFSGLRLGWSVLPVALTLESTVAGELNEMFRIGQSIRFWGASNLAQQGGIAALSEQCQEECQEIVNYYLDNARILKEGLEAFGLTCFGGSNNPYIWVKGAEGMSSWDVFNQLLFKAGIVGVPGSLFGPSGEGFLRLSTLCSREDIEKAMEKL